MRVKRVGNQIGDEEGAPDTPHVGVADVALHAGETAVRGEGEGVSYATNRRPVLESLDDVCGVRLCKFAPVARHVEEVCVVGHGELGGLGLDRGKVFKPMAFSGRSTARRRSPQISPTASRSAALNKPDMEFISWNVKSPRWMVKNLLCKSE